MTLTEKLNELRKIIGQQEFKMNQACINFGIASKEAERERKAFKALKESYNDVAGYEGMK